MADDNHAQDQPFTIRSHWWLPGQTRKTAGNLVYDEESLLLDLYGGLNDAYVESLFSSIPEKTQFPIVHGETLDGEPLTLINAFYTQWKADTPSLPPQKGTKTELLSTRIEANGLLHGVHLSSLEDLFESCRLEIPSFDTWLGDSPFKIDLGRACETVRVEYCRPANDEFTLADLNLVVRFVRSVKPPGMPRYSPAIQHRTYVEITPLAPMTVTWFRNRAGEIVDLLSVLYGNNLLSRRFWLFRETPDDATVTVYHPRHKVTIPEYETMEIVFRFDKLKPHFNRLLENWLGGTKVLKRARSMLVSSERRPSKFIELRFLPLVHAAEVLTKEVKNSTIVEPARFSEIRAQLIKSIPDGVPKELIDAIKGSLGHANGHNLNRKLTNMLSELSDETCRLFCVDNTTFIKGIVDTRNYYTHYSAKPRQLKGVELHWAIRKLSLMLRIVLLVKAGVPEPDIQAMVGSHPRLSQERGVWRAVSEEGSPVTGVVVD